MIVETADVAGTRRLGARCAGLLRPGDVLALSGDLGTGKTAFTQGLAFGLGITCVVTSPTFVLVNEYPLPGGHSLHHVDCYRLADAPLEMWDVGLGDLVAGDDIVVIEWAERAWRSCFPRATWKSTLPTWGRTGGGCALWPTVPISSGW